MIRRSRSISGIFRYIPGLEANRRLDLKLTAHYLLYQKLQAFLTNVPAVNLAENPVTSYFRLPIIDISGPSGLATGYYVNALARFVRNHGFFDNACEVIWSDPPPAGSPPDTKPAPRSKDMRISDVVAVRPPSLMMRSHREDDSLLADSLERLGLYRRRATIRRLRDEPPDLRDYAGDFLVRSQDKGAADFVQPAVLIEIPTTLYALPHAPRLRKLLPRNDALRLRRLRGMLDSFEAVMTRQIQTASNPYQESHFHFISIEQLGPTLREIGVL